MPESELQSLQPRLERSDDPVRDAELRVEWIKTQREAFTEVGYELALGAMQRTLDQHRASRLLEIQNSTDQMEPVTTS